MPPRKKKPEPLRPEDRSTVSPPSHEPPATDPDGAGPATTRTWQPDPFVLMAVTLGAGRTSPRMRLYRSNRLNQMAIGFDERPAPHYRTRLREDGWRWREDEGVWTKQLDRERRAAGQLQAERLFTEIGDAIRADRGLEPERGVGS